MNEVPTVQEANGEGDRDPPASGRIIDTETAQVPGLRVQVQYDRANRAGAEPSQSQSTRGSPVNSCARCLVPLATKRLTSQRLVAAFCSWGCYDAAWAAEIPRVPARGGLPVQDDVDYVDMAGPNETTVG